MSISWNCQGFYSDILRAILDSQSKHGEGILFLRLFVDFLIKVANFKGRPGLREDPWIWRDVSRMAGLGCLS